MNYLGDYSEDDTVRIALTTNDGSGGAVAPSSAFEVGDFKIFKDGSATEKTSTNGLTISSPFDSITGLHKLEIDTSNDTGDAGFWVTGSDYWVVLSPDETVDSQTVVAVVGTFSIENRYMRGTDSASTLTAAQVNAEVDTALADYDGPTKAELDAGFAALNDLSAAEVNTEVDTALSDYDSPTKAEMDAGLAALNDLSAAQVNAEVDTALSDYDGPTRAEATSDKAEILTRLGTPADTDVSTDIANVKTEVDKVPRQGSTHRHRQTAANTGNKSADVIIEAAS